MFIFCSCHSFYFVHVVEYNANIAHTTYTSFSTDLRQTIFQTRVTEYAFFGFISFPVIEDFFVWTRWNTMSPTAAYVLRYENHTIFVAFINRARWTCSYTCRVQAVVTKTRQITHEYFFVVKYDIFAHLSQVHIGTSMLTTSQIVIPVRAPSHFHFLFSHKGTRSSNWLVVFTTTMNQCFIVVSPRFEIILQLWLFRMEE